MKFENPRVLALYLSLIISAISFVILALTGFITAGGLISWIALAVSIVLLFVIQYLLIKHYLEKFIYDKIKLIYKTIHSLKRRKSEKNGLFSESQGNIIENVRQEVITWAHDRKEEIDELRRMETYRREFLANVSHELKTPLFNLQGFTLTLLEGGLEDPEVNRGFLEKSQKNIERMITIVQDLEVISRLEAGEATPTITRFNLWALTSEVFEMLEPRAKQRNIRLMFGTDNVSEVNVLADREKIRQVLVNLLDNSIKYGQDNGRTKVTFYNMDENILTEVSDNGIGIDEMHLGRLFERFYRIDKHRNRSYGGSGLGLAIVKHIIEAHDQAVTVRSTPGIGSTFSFTLKKA